MPQVPTYRKNIEIQGSPNFKVNDTITAEQLGMGPKYQEMMTKGITLSSDIAKQAKKDADHSAILDAENKLMNFENTFMYGDDGKSGAYMRNGKDSFNLKNELDSSYDSTYSKIYEGLSNDDQRQAFEERASRRKSSMDQSILRHIANESDKYLDQTTKDFIDNETGSAIQQYQNLGRVADSIINITDESNRLADRKGLSDESRKNFLDENISKLHSGIIERMVKGGDDIKAQEYFDNVKGNISGKYLKGVEGLLEESSTLGFSQRFADVALSKGLSEQQALKEASRIEDPKKRDASERRIYHLYSLNKQAKAEQQAAVFESATNIFDETGGKIDISLLAKMDAETRSKFREYQDKNPVLDDSKTYYDLYQLAINPKTRNKFLDHNIMLEKGKLNKDHLNKLITLQKDIKSGSGDASKKLDGAYSDTQVAEMMYTNATGDLYRKNERFNNFKMAFDDAIENYKVENNKPYLNNSEVRNIANDLLKEVVYKEGSFLGFSYKNKEKLFNIDIKDIPKNMYDAIAKSLEQKGVQVNDDNIKRAYIRAKIYQDRQSK